MSANNLTQLRGQGGTHQPERGNIRQRDGNQDETTIPRTRE